MLTTLSAVDLVPERTPAAGQAPQRDEVVGREIARRVSRDQTGVDDAPRATVRRPGRARDRALLEEEAVVRCR